MLVYLDTNKKSFVHLQIQKSFEQRRREGIPGTMQDRVNIHNGALTVIVIVIELKV